MHIIRRDLKDVNNGHYITQKNPKNWRHTEQNGVNVGPMAQCIQSTRTRVKLSYKLR